MACVAGLRTAGGNTLKNKRIMKTISVKAVKRDEYGKKAAKAVRREGMVPCVLSGNGESVSFSVDPREIKAVRRSSTPSASRSSTSISTALPRVNPYPSPFRYA